jgi:hypothetical protein
MRQHSITRLLFFAASSVTNQTNAACASSNQLFDARPVLIRQPFAYAWYQVVVWDKHEHAGASDGFVRSSNNCGSIATQLPAPP